MAPSATPDPFGRNGHRDGLDPPGDVFIVGAPRSGTTWLQTVLAQHPGFVSVPETHLFVLLGEAERLYTKYPQGIGPAAVIDRADFDQWLSEPWQRLRTQLLAARPGTTRVLEKTPMHALHMDLIRRLVPGARLVVLVRDPRDTVNSLLDAGSGWGSPWAPRVVENAIARYRRAVESALASMHAADTLLVRYEELCSGPQAWGELLSFLELVGWSLPDLGASPRELSIGLVMRLREGRLTPTTLEVPTGFSFHSRAGRHRQLSGFERRYVEYACRDLMDRLGYDGSRSRLGWPDRIHLQARRVPRVVRALWSRARG